MKELSQHTETMKDISNEAQPVTNTVESLAKLNATKPAYKDETNFKWDGGRWKYLGIKNEYAEQRIKNDLDNLRDRFTKRSELRGNPARPLVGDFVRIDGELKRIASIWNYKEMKDGPVFQPGGNYSYHLNKNGSVSHSGGLDPAIPLNRLEDSGEYNTAVFWMFSQEIWKGHNGIDVMIPVYVWELK